MANVTLDPYIFFQGNCREAMEFYKDVFGGELTVMTYGETQGEHAPQGNKDLIMHAMLDGDVKIMGSDSEKASDKAAKISLSLGGASEERLRPIFEKLSQGGSVFSELKKEFWGDVFGSLTDKFGVEWMVNIPAEKTD